MMAAHTQPMSVLAEGSQRTRGDDARESNIRAGKAVAGAVRTTLGPRGMDKMLIDSGGEVVITNDGATILSEMDIEHPAAKMLVDVADSQEESVGDGTTTAAVLAGELLVRAEELLDDDIHPTVVVEGYHEAARRAVAAVDDAVLVGDVDDGLLASVAESAMTGTGTGDATAETLAALVVDAVRQVAGDDGRLDRGDVHTHVRTGAAASATELLRGVVVDGGPLTDAMPREVTDAAVAVLDADLEVRTGDVDVEYAITTVDQLDAAVAAEDEELRGYASTLADAGVDVVVCTGDVDDRVASHLDRAGLLAFADVDDDDAAAVARATGARRLGSLADVDADDVGHADRVGVDRFGETELTVVEGGAAAAAVTLLVRGGTRHVADELARALGDAVDAAVAALDDGGVVPGAGATEVAVAAALRDAAASVAGRQQLAVEAFADAVDSVPRTLAQNAGLDPIDALVDLRERHERTGRAGVVDGAVADPVEAGVLDPAAVKREAVRSAAEAATMILRIDDVIAAE
jgi:thermosome